MLDTFRHRPVGMELTAGAVVRSFLLSPLSIPKILREEEKIMDESVKAVQENRTGRVSLFSRFRTGFMLLAVAVMSCASAFASGEGAEATTSDVQTVVSAMDTLSSLMSAVVRLVLGNPILVVFFAVSFASVGFVMFRKARNTAGG